MTELDDQALECATERAREVGQNRQRTGPLVRRVRYDHRWRALMLYLSTGYAVVIPVRFLQGIADADPKQLRQAVLSPSRTGIRFPALDADFALDGLLEGVFGTERWMQGLRAIAARGGSARTEAKRTAARENGKRGGRPRGTKVSRERERVTDRPPTEQPGGRAV